MITHAFSQPAWDCFPLLELADLTRPIWSPEAASLNDRYSDWRSYPLSLAGGTDFLLTPKDYQEDIDALAKCCPYTTPTWQQLPLPSNSILTTTRDDSPLKAIRRLAAVAYHDAVRFRTRLNELRYKPRGRAIHITFGNTSPHISKYSRRHTPHVVVEHGQVRWISTGSPRAARQRKDFASLAKDSQHVWVTNVDEHSLTLANNLFPGRWSVLPHPYVLDARAPYTETDRVRETMISDTQADFLLLNPSSMSIGGDQQKGTEKLLLALSQLRHQENVRVGAFFVRWGSSVDQVCSMIHSLNIADQCRLVEPMTRISLQRFMTHFDLVSDQFDYDAFGALTIRTLEQGMPLLSRPIGNWAAELMGGRPPVIAASTVEEIKARIVESKLEKDRLGRVRYLEFHRQSGRAWVAQRHHHSITRALQVERYQQLLSPSASPAEPGRWGALPNWNPE